MEGNRVAPRPVVNSLEPPVTGWEDLTPAELSQRLGLQSVRKLSFNESPYGPSPQAVAAMQAAACHVNYYSDMEAKELRRKIGKKFNLDRDRVFVSNGGDEAINLLTSAFVSPRNRVLMPWPTFGQYAVAALLMDGEPLKVPVRKSDWKVDLAALSAVLTDRTKIIFLCNPNNPTGVAVKGEELRQFLRSIPPRILVCLDEAYAEFATDKDFVSGAEWLDEFPNLVVIRTFSKIYGLAGLRVGYGLAAADIVDKVQRVRSPFNVNSLAQSGAAAALDDTVFIREVAQKNAAQRIWLTDQLTELGWRVAVSQTNFLFADTGHDAKPIAEAARAEGFVFRAGGWGCPTCLRVSLGTPEQNALLAGILKKIVQIARHI